MIQKKKEAFEQKKIENESIVIIDNTNNESESLKIGNKYK